MFCFGVNMARFCSLLCLSFQQDEPSQEAKSGVVPPPGSGLIWLECDISVCFQAFDVRIVYSQTLYANVRIRIFSNPSKEDGPNGRRSRWIHIDTTFYGFWRENRECGDHNWMGFRVDGRFYFHAIFHRLWLILSQFTSKCHVEEVDSTEFGNFIVEFDNDRTCFNTSETNSHNQTGAAMAEWLRSWLEEQEVQGSIPRLATFISVNGLSPASKSRYGWNTAKTT